MSYNLIDERWIPVRRASGARDWIAPWQLSERSDPVIALASPRPDFDGALVQFLIGLVQTTAAPETKRAWEDTYDRPPDPKVLQAAFATVRDAFELLGDGPRFMQDLTLSDPDATVPIERLLIDAPGEQALERNTDHFVKRDSTGAMGYPAAAMAVLCLQLNAPSGGRGYRTSLRGGGPLTTILLGEDLFRTAWLNVLRRDLFEAGRGRADLRGGAGVFPWMAATRTSEKSQTITPDDMHPAQHFWAMPRRVRLVSGGAPGRCDITGMEGVPVIRSFQQVWYGGNYKGPFLHPLTPYTRLPGGEPPNPRKGQAEGLPYRDWPVVVTGFGDRDPASVVVAYGQDGRFLKQAACRIHAFGFDMDNAKAVSWNDATVPLLWVSENYQVEFSELATQLVSASEEVRKTTISKVKDALLRRPGDRKGDLGYLSRELWSATESGFYAALEQARDLLEAGKELASVREGWLELLHQAALRVFEGASQEQGEFAATDVKRIAKGHTEVARFTSPRSSRLRTAVGLPPIPMDGKSKERA